MSKESGLVPDQESSVGANRLAGHLAARKTGVAEPASAAAAAPEEAAAAEPGRD